MSKKIKTTSLETLIDKHIGKRGSSSREDFEDELRAELLAKRIKDLRLAKKLTQEQLGQLVGVQKAQISKIENNFTSVRLDTLLKVFQALGARLHFRIEMA